MIYEHNLAGDWETRKVLLDGHWLPIVSSQKIRNLWDCFAWGYAGYGPAQLALTVLLRLWGKDFALRHYQDFKCQVIALLPQNDFIVTFFYDDEKQNFGIKE